jgi:hypothetical protein
MRGLGPFGKKSLAKVQPVKSILTAQELHAYYIALISSSTLTVAHDGLRLKRPSKQ